MCVVVLCKVFHFLGVSFPALVLRVFFLLACCFINTSTDQQEWRMRKRSLDATNVHKSNKDGYKLQSWGHSISLALDSGDTAKYSEKIFVV